MKWFAWSLESGDGVDELILDSRAQYVDFFSSEAPLSGRVDTTIASGLNASSQRVDYFGVETIQARLQNSDAQVVVHADDAANDITLTGGVVPLIDIDDRTAIQLVDLGNDAGIVLNGHGGADRVVVRNAVYSTIVREGYQDGLDVLTIYGDNLSYTPSPHSPKSAVFDTGLGVIDVTDFDEIIVESNTLVGVSFYKIPSLRYRVAGSDDSQAKAFAFVTPGPEATIPVVGLLGSDETTLLSDPDRPTNTNGGVLIVNSGLEAHESHFFDVAGSDGQAVPHFELFAAVIEPAEFVDLTGGQIAEEIDHNHRFAGRGTVPFGGNGLISVEMDHNHRIAAVVNNEPTDGGDRIHSVLEILDANGETVLATGSNIPGAIGNGVVTSPLPAGNYLVRVSNTNEAGDGNYEIVIFDVDDASAVTDADGPGQRLKPGDFAQGSIPATPEANDIVALTPHGNTQSSLRSTIRRH
jgi:hypothetical protein